ncbi:MAG: GNAT family N-acetyltransferase [Fimbriimonadaceae bacterium]|nr:GNAT family N-acetyltransferase [Fimbriimonadaceae bacterium]
MQLHACTAADLPARMAEIQWQAMWRHYVLPGHVKAAGSSFESAARANGFELPACLIAVVDGRDAGFCWGALRGDEAWCGGFGVRPEYRGQGVGQALLAATATALRGLGAKVWRLEVVQANPRAVLAYERAGMRRGRDLGLYRGSVRTALAADEEIVDATAATCLEQYQQWTQVRRTWGASPQCLRRRQEALSAKALQRAGRTVAFMLHNGGSVLDLGLAGDEPGSTGLKLLGALPAFNFGNVPDDDPVQPALDRAAGVSCWTRQWEMEWSL